MEPTKQNSHKNTAAAVGLADISDFTLKHTYTIGTDQDCVEWELLGSSH